MLHVFNYSDRTSNLHTEYSGNKTVNQWIKPFTAKHVFLILGFEACHATKFSNIFVQSNVVYDNSHSTGDDSLK